MARTFAHVGRLRVRAVASRRSRSEVAVKEAAVLDLPHMMVACCLSLLCPFHASSCLLVNPGV